MERICVTGGSGFIGTNLVEYYIRQGEFEVYNIDKSRPRNPDHLKYWKQVDILDENALANAILEIQPHYTIHLAARTDLLETKDINNYRENFDGTRNLIDALSKVNTVKRVVFASSMLVCKLGYRPSSDMDYSATTLYGMSKVMMENILRSASVNYSWAIIRPTSIWGPWFDEPYKYFFLMVMRGRYFHIGRKHFQKTFGFVGNAVYQIDAIARSQQPVHGRVFYLADYEYYRVSEWADEIATELNIKNRTYPFIFFKMLGFVGDVLKKMGIVFPMTSFRLKNLTTDVQMDMSAIASLAPKLPYSRLQAVKITLDWLVKHEKR